MKTKFIYCMVLLSVTLIYGCNKNNPKPDKYVGVFTYTTTTPGAIYPIIEFYKITKTGSDYIEITVTDYDWEEKSATFILQKNNKKVTGLLPPYHSINSLTIDGTWEKKKGQCIISGTFLDSTSPDGSYKGTFELKQQ